VPGIYFLACTFIVVDFAVVIEWRIVFFCVLAVVVALGIATALFSALATALLIPLLVYVAPETAATFELCEI